MKSERRRKHEYYMEDEQLEKELKMLQSLWGYDLNHLNSSIGLNLKKHKNPKINKIIDKEFIYAKSFLMYAKIAGMLQQELKVNSMGSIQSPENETDELEHTGRST